LSKPRLFFLLLFILLAASRLCHVAILWEGDAYPLAAAGQMLHGSVLYRQIWFDKPPLLAIAYLAIGAHPGIPLRIAGALYAFLACLIAYGFARDLWGKREALWAAGLLGFFLTFDFPSAVMPVASDLLMLAPHIAAVWLAWKRRAFWSGAMAAVAFWVSPKGLFVAAACAVWFPAGIPLMAAGFAAVSGIAVALLGACGALEPYWQQVWIWGRLYAGSTFLENPLRNGLLRTANWAGFHVAIVLAAAWFARKRESLRWVAWTILAFLGVAAGLRFFPRYYFLLLAPITLMAARGFTLMGRRRELIALLLLIPATRFGITYATALRDPAWRDTAMDRDSRTAAAAITARATPQDTLFVWGYRPELYVYTGLKAATIYLDSQPLTGVPADRHLTSSEPVETEEAARRRRQLAGANPAFIVDGLGLYNPKLAITQYPELKTWLSHYQEIARTSGSVVYRYLARTPTVRSSTRTASQETR
jgi:hypothetical protein